MRNSGKMINKTSTRGFTLIELMVTIAVIAVMVAITVPNLNNFMRSNRMTSQINSFVSALQLARSEAVKRGAHVVLCASSNQTTCNSTQWEQGWIVFVDGSNTFSISSPSGRPSGTDQVLRVGSVLGGNDTLRDSTNTGAMIYLPSGAPVTSNSAGTTFLLCDPKTASDTATTWAKRARAVNIKLSGIIARATDTNTTKDGIVNDYQDTNVTCP